MRSTSEKTQIKGNAIAKNWEDFNIYLKHDFDSLTVIEAKKSS